MRSQYHSHKAIPLCRLPLWWSHSVEVLWFEVWPRGRGHVRKRHMGRLEARGKSYATPSQPRV